MELRETSGGFKYLFGQKAILGMLGIATASNIFCGALSIILLVFVKDEMHQSAAFYGSIESIFIFGMVCLALLLSFINLPRSGRRYLIMVLFFIWSASFYFMGSSKLVAASYIACWLIGAGESVWTVIFDSFVLRRVAPSQIGRFYSTFTLIQRAFQPVTIFIFSMLMVHHNASSMLISISMALFGIGAVVPFIKGISAVEVIEENVATNAVT